MSILIKKSGILDTFQDLGRNGNRRKGINPNGAMDKFAVRLLNILLGNDENEAALEMHFPAGEIEFTKPIQFALGGAEFEAELNKTKIENWKLHIAEKGDKLSFTGKILGNRCYLSVKDGFDLENWLGSKSTNVTAKKGGFEGRKLKKGDEINFAVDSSGSMQECGIKIAQSIIPIYSNYPTVRVTAGAELKDVTALSEQEFLSQSYTISKDSNRMGFRLKGEPLHLLNGKDLVSSAVDFGTIQLLPDGQLIILMADHQTTGGYPRIAHVIEKDLPLVAQLGAGDGIGFHMISNAEAEDLKVRQERDIKFLKMGIKLKYGC